MKSTSPTSSAAPKKENSLLSMLGKNFGGGIADNTRGDH